MKNKCKDCFYFDEWISGGNDWFMGWCCRYEIKKKIFSPIDGELYETIEIDCDKQNKNGNCKYFKFLGEKIRLQNKRKEYIERQKKEEMEDLLIKKLKENKSIIKKILGKQKTYDEIRNEVYK